MKSCLFVLCIDMVTPFSFTWMDMIKSWERISHGDSCCVSLPFSHGKSDREWRTRTQNNTRKLLIPTLCCPTAGRMMSFTCGALGWQRLFCACANTHTHTHTHTHTLTSLPVCGSREQSRLNWTHMWLLSAGGTGAFIIRFPSHSSSPENSKSCCVVTKPPLTL